MGRKSRFQQEISGELGEFWYRHAISEVENLVGEANCNALVEEDGAIKWVSSGNYLPSDCCEKLAYAGYPFNLEATRIKRERQSDEILTNYRQLMKNHKYSDEELYEMHSAFGDEGEIVDIITGERIC